MAAKLDDNMEEFLTCSICLERLKNPKTLKECLHSFCAECLDGLKRTTVDQKTGVQCPLCWTFTDQSSFKPSFFIKGLIDVQTRAKTSQKLSCSCDERNNVTWKCLDCKITICEKCKKYHAYFPITKNHQIVSIEESSKPFIDELVFCLKHHNKAISFNCKDCETMLCIKCKIIDHESHKTETVEMALERLIPLVVANKEKLEDNLGTLGEQINDVEEKIEQTKVSFSDCSTEIQRDADQQVKRIRQQEKQLLKEVRVKEEEELTKLDSVKANLQHRVKAMRNLKCLIGASVDTARHTSLLQEIQGGMLHMVQNCSQKVKTNNRMKVEYPKYKSANISFAHIGATTYSSSPVFTASGIYNSRNYRNIPIPIEEMKELNLKQSIQLQGQVRRIAIVNDSMWLPSCYTKERHHYFDCNIRNTNEIFVYDFDCNLVQTIMCGNMQPTSVVQRRNGNVIVACRNTGLHEMTLTGDVVKCVIQGSFCDVAVNKDNIFALDYNQSQVYGFRDVEQGDLQHFNIPVNDHYKTGARGWHQIQSGVSPNEYNTLLATPSGLSPHEYNNLLATQSGVSPHEYNTLLATQSGVSPHEYNTLLATQDKLYVCGYGDHQVAVYSIESQQLLYSFSVQHQCPLPSLCGVDSDDHILMASYDNGTLHCWDGGNEWTGVKHQQSHSVTDVVRGYEENIWNKQVHHFTDVVRGYEENIWNQQVPHITDVVMDSEKNIWTVNHGANTVNKFT